MDTTLLELALMDLTGIQLERNVLTRIKQSLKLFSCHRNASITLLKSTGKVKSLEDKIEAQKGSLNVEGIHTQHVGIAHTRLILTFDSPD